MGPRTAKVALPADTTVAAQTPAPVLLTLRGQLPNLPLQLLEPTLSAESDLPLLLQMPLTDWFCLNPNHRVLGADLLENYDGRGIESFAALPKAITFLSTRAAGSAEFISKTPGSAVSISTDAIAHKPVITPRQVVELHRALNTAYLESPSDSPPLQNPSKRAVPKSVARAQMLCDDLFENLAATGGVSVATSPSTELGIDADTSPTRIFVAVQGGVDNEQRIQSARNAADRYKKSPTMVSGFAISGLYAGEDPQERWTAVLAAIDQLPHGPLRSLPGGIGAPCDVLEAVRCGVDLVESTYPFHVAASGYALDLEHGTKHNMRDRRWERYKGPMVAGCECIACKPRASSGGFYSRGYIRHLLDVHEMLGESLLAAHNLRNYLDWFARLRSAIACGKFEQFYADFHDQRERERAGASTLVGPTAARSTNRVR